MKSKVLISRFALSTFLLSAVAFPSVTNADGANTTSSTTAEAPRLIAVSELKSAPVSGKELSVTTAATEGTVKITTTSKSAQAAPVITSFTSPVELAEKYAPDTVEEWKSTLTQYDKLVQKHSPAATLTANEAVEAIETVSTVPAPVASDAKLIETVEVIKSTKKGSAAETAKAVKISEEVKATKSAPAPTLQPVSIAIIDKEDASFTLNRIEAVEAQPAVETLIAQEAGTVTVQTYDPDLTFIKAEIALAKAAESKDAQSIKNALKQLMEQYKIQIAELEQASE
ncbi:hypothetical protein PCCS19_19900 [Paenibacillus sp. CCS19]|uniref:hypothetical protein n=1 Tax=Paenibacillus sp. CCS19 TaxID=3158387 RepID=UPI0025626E00|nr:hypothetical protein [Paenibacillus cellulosilyticus]GMK38936.1 hypothetical protein PCCS19_19900 [Paenibacillus cellulosilyticus]